jgi:hypothetical protein
VKTSPGRAIASRIAAIAFAVVLPLATVATWGVGTVANSDRWVATLHPLASDRTLTTYVANEGAARVISQLHVQDRIQKLLPPGAAFLSGTLTSQLQLTLASAIGRALRSGSFQSLWDRENRLTHDVAVAVLEGRANSTIAVTHSVVLNLSPAILEGLRQFDLHGNHFFDPLRHALLHERSFVLRILDSTELQRAQGYFHLAITLRWLLDVSALLLAIASIFAARPLHRGLRRLALSTIISAAVTYSALRIGIHLAVPFAPTPIRVTDVILNAVTSFLRRDLVALIILGFAALILSYLLANSGDVRRLRLASAATINRIFRWTLGLNKSASPLRSSATSELSRERASRLLHLGDLGAVLIAVALLVWWVHSVLALVEVTIVASAWFTQSHRLHRRVTNLTSNPTSEAIENDATTPP